MATQQPGLRLGTQFANADLRTHQFKFMKAVNSSGKAVIDIVSAAGGAGVGVLQNKPNTGEVADVMVEGVSKVIAGGALATAGVQISSDATGRAKAAATTEVVFGILLTTCANAGEYVEVLLGASGSGGRIP